MPASGQVTELLSAWRNGDANALEKLIPLVYEELRRLANRYMGGERVGHTLQPTALVHEAYLRLAREQDRNWESRAHFFAVAAQIMRNLLVDHARTANRAKRGGGAVEVELTEVMGTISVNPDDLLSLDEALNRLVQLDPRAARIVELRCFVGLDNQEIAAVLHTSEKTVTRDWNAARAWLQAELRKPSQP
jgi:RNA polymerase sigma factor (TIGR02999 family)